jgi:hypothetical protein
MNIVYVGLMMHYEMDDAELSSEKMRKVSSEWLIGPKNEEKSSFFFQAQLTGKGARKKSH